MEFSYKFKRGSKLGFNIIIEKSKRSFLCLCMTMYSENDIRIDRVFKNNRIELFENEYLQLIDINEVKKESQNFYKKYFK